MTQQNAALVEEAAAAAESLQDQAAKLAEAVSVFNLGQGSQSYSRGGGQRAQGSRSAVAGRPKAALAGPATRSTKLAASGGNDEWEEF
jgi:hypothetical protein